MNYRHTLLIVCACFTVTLVTTPYLSAQSGACENGLAQQLEVGMTGWVIPEPPLAVNVRNAPGGSQVGQIQPGETFIVLDGPTCAQTFSWWEIESENGISGWIAEGVDDYFVEPYTAVGTSSDAVAADINFDLELRDNLSIVVEDDTCDGESQFEVGDTVEITNPDFEIFYGHPGIEGSFFSGTVMQAAIEAGPNNFMADQFTFSRDEESREDYINVMHYVVDGAQCVNGGYMVKLGRFDRFRINTNSGIPNIFVTSDPAFWYREQDLAVSSDITPTDFVAEPYAWYPVDDAPVLDTTGQLAYTNAGGGGSLEHPWIPEHCELGEYSTAITYKQITNSNIEKVENCFAIYPVVEGIANVRLVQPDGTVFDTFEKETESLLIERMLPDISYDTLETEAVIVDLPDFLGVQAGLWTIEVEMAGNLYERSYYLHEGPEEEELWFCAGPHPRLLLGLYDSESVDLVLLARTGVGAPGAGGSVQVTAPAVEIGRWTIPLSADGRRVIDPRFRLPAEGVIVAVEPGADWQSGYIIYNDGQLIGGRNIIDRNCADKDAVQLVVPGVYATGEGTFTFEGVEGQSFNFAGHIHTEFQARALDEAFGSAYAFSPGNISITLIAPGGTIIVSEDPQSEILTRDIVLPESGEYRLEVTFEESTTSGIPGWIIILGRG